MRRLLLLLFLSSLVTTCTKGKLNIPYIMKDRRFFDILCSVCNKPFKRSAGYEEIKEKDGNIYVYDSDEVMFRSPNCYIYFSDYKLELTSYNNRCIDKYCKIKEIYKGYYIAQNSGLGKKCDRTYRTFVYDKKFSFSFKLPVWSHAAGLICKKKITPDNKYYNNYYHGKDPGGVSVEIAKKLIDYFEKHLDLKDYYDETIKFDETLKN